MRAAKTPWSRRLADNQRVSLIRATKTNATPSRLFVDFLFVDNGEQIDSKKYVSGHDLTATMPSISTEI
jgi:hypothetical protein